MPVSEQDFTWCWNRQCQAKLPMVYPFSPRGPEHYCPDCVTTGKTSYVTPDQLAADWKVFPTRSSIGGVASQIWPLNRGTSAGSLINSPKERKAQ